MAYLREVEPYCEWPDCEDLAEVEVLNDERRSRGRWCASHGADVLLGTQAEDDARLLRQTAYQRMNHP